MSKPALLLFAHGSSDPGWALPFERIRDVVARSRPGMPVALAYLERMAPSFAEGIAQLTAAGATEVTVAPLFLAPGGHVKNDLPALAEAAAQRHGVAIRVLPSLGEASGMIDAIARWAIEQAG
ncbi:MAG: CbiX/SirB N-terminal domain-containing protein [Betaproteobacteria bacterium]|nr:CbiX/SirB N-terminal domain-containing protein [Betaproteobacteria bacterium]